MSGFLRLITHKYTHATVPHTPTQIQPSSLTQTGLYTHPSAVVVGEVVSAGLLWHGGRGFGYGDVLQVQEAELHLHGDERVQVTACEVTAHLSPQQRTQPISPDTVLLHAQAGRQEHTHTKQTASTGQITYSTFATHSHTVEVVS